MNLETKDPKDMEVIIMNKPVLVIMAAGMGSRYGGLKQLDPVDNDGHIIMDFSMYDAKRAGFEKVVFIIKHEIEEEFKEHVGKRMEKYMDVAYAYQNIDNIPEGYEVPEGRVKPWGTAHAVYSCMDEIDGPFAVINADDYYGVEAFKLIYDYLSTHADDDKYRYTMVGYHLANTVTDNGYVSRGVCETNENGELVSVTERTRIEKYNGGVAYTEDDGNTWVQVPDDTTVSMNMWGFTKSILEEIKAGFPAFLDKGLQENPMKCEYFLPTVVSNLLAEDKATVSVLKSADKWYGVTYKEDKKEQEEIDNDYRKQAKELVNKMDAYLKKDSTLPRFDDRDTLFKVPSSSNDFYVVTRDAYFHSLKLFKQGGAQETGQIKQIKVLAGDINDFYVEMTYTSTITYLGETETMDITYKYRIKKGKDCYLVAFIGYRVPGDIGLVKCDPVIEKDVSTNEDYAYSVGG